MANWRYKSKFIVKYRHDYLERMAKENVNVSYIEYNEANELGILKIPPFTFSWNREKTKYRLVTREGKRLIRDEQGYWEISIPSNRINDINAWLYAIKKVYESNHGKNIKNPVQSNSIMESQLTRRL